MTTALFPTGAALISPDEVYRYSLTRRWAKGPAVAWIMLNPSTADADVDDPTIRRVIGFSGSWGYAAAQVLNLYALRATDPADLWTHPDPVGPDNDAVLRASVRMVNTVVVAWGAHPLAGRRALQVASRLPPYRLLCLGVCQSGAPRHPLYVRADTAPAAWNPPAPPAR